RSSCETNKRTPFAPSPSRPRSVSSANHKKVVIVDDDRALRDRLQTILEQDGYDVAQAPSGLRLLSLLEVDRPDLILLDVAMSWINGFELCRAMKANRSYQNIPVVFISGRSEAS